MSGFGQIIGGVIGAVVGFYAGGNVALGYAIGSGVGGYVTAEDITQPLLEDFSVDSNGYGTVIKIINGTDKVQCVPIWAEFNTQKNTESAKGGPSSTTFEYSVDIALLIGEPVDGILRIWHGPDLIVDNRTVSESGGVELESGFLVSYSFYDGNASQEVDPLMESYLGAGYVPAYRGVSTLVISGLDITDTGGRVMPIFVEVRKADGTDEITTTAIDHDSNVPGYMPVYARTDSTMTFLFSEIDNYWGAQPNRQFFIKSTVGVAGSISVSGYIFTSAQKTGVEPKVLAAGIAQMHKYQYPTYDLWLRHDGYYEITCEDHKPTTLKNGWIASASYSMIYLESTVWLPSSGVVLVQHPYLVHEDGSVISIDAASGAITAVPLNRAYGGQDGLARVSQAVSASGNELYYSFGSVIVKYIVGYDAYGRAELTETGFRLDAADLPTTGGAIKFLHVAVNGDVYFMVYEETGSSDSEVGSRIYSYDADLVDLKTITANLSGHLRKYSQGIKIDSNIAYITSNYGSIIAVELCADTSQDEAILRADLGQGDLGTGAHPNQYNRGLAILNRGIQSEDNLVMLDASSAAPEPLSDIVANYCRNLDPSKYDTSQLTDTIDGITLDRATTGNSAIATLQKLFFFGGYSDETGKIIFRPAGSTPTITIDADDLGAGVDEGSDSRVIMTIPGEKSRPKEVRIGYRPRAAQYENAVQTIRLAASDTQEVIENSYKIVISDQTAKNIAHRMAHDMAVRAKVSISLPLDYQDITPGDVISVPDGERTLVVRVSRVARSQVGIVSIDGERVLPAPPPQAATEFIINGQQIVQVSGPELIVYQGILRDQDDNLGIYIIGGQRGTPTSPSAISTSVAGGAWNNIGNVPGITVTGYTLSAMPDGKPGITDYQRSVFVMLWDDQATLDSITYAQLMNEQNAALIGNEVILFKTATLQANGSFLLEGIVGGRQGTEQEMASHASGDRFALLDESLMFRLYYQQSTIGVSRSISLATPRSSSTDSKQITHAGASLKPWAPVHVSAVLSVDIDISWVPRYRVNSSWVNGVDVTADANEQSWRVDIYDQADDVTLLRTATVSTASYPYVDHAADGVNTSAKIRICITQISTIVGDGFKSDNMVIIKT